MLRMVRRLDSFTVPYKGLEKSSPYFLESPWMPEGNPYMRDARKAWLQRKTAS